MQGGMSIILRSSQSSEKCKTRRKELSHTNCSLASTDRAANQHIEYNNTIENNHTTSGPLAQHNTHHFLFVSWSCWLATSYKRGDHNHVGQRWLDDNDCWGFDRRASLSMVRLSGMNLSSSRDEESGLLSSVLPDEKIDGIAHQVSVVWDQQH